MKIHVRRNHFWTPWYYRVVSRNGKILSTSETYLTKRNALRAAKRAAEKTGYEVVVD